METNELMQDNYVLFTWEGEDNVIRVKSIHTGFISCNEVAAIDMKRIKPIPLTEDWLVKFGFKYNDLNGDSGHWQIKHPSDPGLIEILQGEEGFVYNYQIYIKSVHHLQNLYFALTQTQLTVK